MTDNEAVTAFKRASLLNCFYGIFHQVVHKNNTFPVTEVFMAFKGNPY